MSEFHYESDLALSSRCMDLLVQNVGLLETERFVAFLGRERIDYTKWRQNQFEGLSLEELGRATRESGESVKSELRANAALHRHPGNALPEQSS